MHFRKSNRLFFYSLDLLLMDSVEKIGKIGKKIFGHFLPLGSPQGTPHISTQGLNFENRFGQYVFYA